MRNAVLHNVSISEKVAKEILHLGPKLNLVLKGWFQNKIWYHKFVLNVLNLQLRPGKNRLVFKSKFKLGILVGFIGFKLTLALGKKSVLS